MKRVSISVVQDGGVHWERVELKLVKEKTEFFFKNVCGSQ
jgi:hypothetical protein